MFNPLKIFKKAEESGEEPEVNQEEIIKNALKEDGNKTKEIADKREEPASNKNPKDFIKLTTEIDRLKIAVESFGEVRKGLTERITGLSEQIGELRAMILDRDRTIQEIELKSVKAADLVESVHPDKLMIEIQKEDAKFEALKANLEGNEAIMNRIMEELKEVRKKIEFFRGIEEIIKLGEEVKKELVEIKKVEANINIDADKVETIYSELRKKFQDVDLFSGNLQELKINLSQNTKDVDFLKNKVTELADKEELERLVKKVQRYVEALQEINKKSSLSKDVSQLKTMLEGLK
ncbi:hypothetical protein BMS3Abin17_00818 [archaeon BMS3Abin17]|nr:hypothetical protein BMS3Abin17_00818 [archaeon BMS3Abin17]HDZ60088.1 hypothetical protein [Candidatus Pacearchaeota archaeon]